MKNKTEAPLNKLEKKIQPIVDKAYMKNLEEELDICYNISAEKSSANLNLLRKIDSLTILLKEASTHLKMGEPKEFELFKRIVEKIG